MRFTNPPTERALPHTGLALGVGREHAERGSHDHR